MFSSVDDLLTHPAFHGGVAPFGVALLAAISLKRLRLAGLAVPAGFITCMYLVSGLDLVPLTATRKILLLGVLASTLGVVCDLAFKQARLAVLLATMAVAGAIWAFWSVLAQKPASEAWLLGGTTALVVGFLVWTSQHWLAGDGVRVGAAGLGLGLGIGVAAIFSASATYGLYGISIGAGAGAFLLPQMIGGRKWFAGVTFTLTTMLLSGLVGAGAMILAELPWYSLLAFALVPLAARAPGPESGPVWLQAVVFSLYSFAIAALACVLAWPAAQQT